MTDISLPDSVIAAGDKAAPRLFRDDPIYREHLTNIFLAMAKALVEHHKDDPQSRDLVGPDGAVHGYADPEYRYRLEAGTFTYVSGAQK
tara:strand:- start:1608 stop:1874 length:267 start_codon:yes stop_codon:yes gene_type:complete